jgi:HEAT repeat protein
MVLASCAGNESGAAGQGTKSVSTLVAELKAPASNVRHDAASALGMIGREKGPDAILPAVAPLIQALQSDADEMVRLRAAETLGVVGTRNPSVVPALIAALSDKNWEVRSWTATALGTIGPEAKAAAAPLEEALSDDKITESAARALQAIGEPDRAVKRLTVTLDDGAKPEALRVSSAGALGAIGDRSAVPALAKALDDPAVAGTAGSALRQMGESKIVLARAIAHLRSSPDARLRQSAAVTCRDLGPEAAVAIPVLVQALASDKDWDVRQRSAFALAAVDAEGRTAVPALAAALKDTDSSVRQAAARALGELGPKASDAVPMLTAALQHEHQATRNAASEALEKIQKK